MFAFDAKDQVHLHQQDVVEARVTLAKCAPSHIVVVDGERGQVSLSPVYRTALHLLSMHVSQPGHACRIAVDWYVRHPVTLEDAPYKLPYRH